MRAKLKIKIPNSFKQELTAGLFYAKRKAWLSSTSGIRLKPNNQQANQQKLDLNYNSQLVKVYGRIL